MRSSKVTSSKVLGLAVIAGIISATAFAEPAIQPGETLESLSQTKITTTVNGQPGSLQELAASGKIKILGEANTNAAQATDEAPASEVAASEVVTDEAPASETEATQEAPAIESSAANPVNAELAAPAN